MNPVIFKCPQLSDPHYIMTFETHADRTRWFLRHDFVFNPTDLRPIRWYSWHNGSDYSHSVEVIPWAHEHREHAMSLCLKVILTKTGEEVKKVKRIRPSPTKRGQPDFHPNQQEFI